VVFRRENKSDSFQRQISALRQQLGNEADADDGQETPLETEPSDLAPPPPAADPFLRTASSSAGSREPDGYSFPDLGAPPDRGRPDEGMTSLPAPIPTPAVDDDTSVIAPNTIWTGDLETSGTVHIRGRVQGSVVAQNTIFVAEEAQVDASLSATSVIVAGRVNGTIRCRERFEVLPQGRLTGDIQAPKLVIHEGAIVSGQFRMGTPEAANAVAPSAPPVVQRRTARGG
jgi:cytoskeletal protein CcmA (bactofilin family)